MSQQRLHELLDGLIKYALFGPQDNIALQNELGPNFLKEFRPVLTQNRASAANEIKSVCPIEYSTKYHVFEADIKLD